MLKYKELNLLLLLFIVFNNENLPKNKKVNPKSTKKIVLTISATTISILTAVSIIYKLYYEKNTPNNITPTNTELSIVNNITESQDKENSNTITALKKTSSTENTESEVIATPTRDSSTKTSNNSSNNNSNNTKALPRTFPEGPAKSAQSPLEQNKKHNTILPFPVN
jgi:hypothetical protein